MFWHVLTYPTYPLVQTDPGNLKLWKKWISLSRSSWGRVALERDRQIWDLSQETWRFQILKWKLTTKWDLLRNWPTQSGICLPTIQQPLKNGCPIWYSLWNQQSVITCGPKGTCGVLKAWNLVNMLQAVNDDICYPSLTHGQDGIPKGWRWSARYVLPKPLIWRRPSSDPSKLGEEIAFFFSKRPFVNDSNNLPWDSYQPGEYHGNTYQPASEWGSWCDDPLSFHCFHLESPIKKKDLGRASQLANCYIKPMLDCNEMNGGLEHFLCFHSVGNVIIPTDELIFFRGVGIPPKRGYFLLSRLMGFTTIYSYI